MKTALIYPPTCDPTAPYIALPALAGFLRASGEDVLLIDANVEAYHYVLRRAFLQKCAERLASRLARLKRKTHLTHVEKLAYLALSQAGTAADVVPAAIEGSLAILHDPMRFFDPVSYEKAVATITAALQLISAAHAPLTLDFTQYRTPFSLLSLDEIKHDAQPERNPFHDYFSQELMPILERESVKIAGLSVAFPGQIQSAYALALMIRRQLPAVHVTIGGPVMTQMLLRLPEELQKKALMPFDSVVLYEGETALLSLIRTVARGAKPSTIIYGQQEDLSKLPAPDFSSLPLEKYLSPALVLPYDPSRGCYWGKCSFCHYGLTAQGTAHYRQRPVAHIVEHLRQMMARWHNRVFYFSHDTMSPQLAVRISQSLSDQGITCRWGTDMRPERSLTPEACRTLAAGGALSAALGIESASPRVLRLINKGVSIEEMSTAVANLAQAGIAVEAMCFTDFPTETYREALATIHWLEKHQQQLALFICGSFGLVSGARVAQFPEEYGLQETWYVQGDELRSQLFYAEKKPSKTTAERQKIDDALDHLAQSWSLHRYPWAGSLSTAHTLLWYEHADAAVFKRCAGVRRQSSPLAVDKSLPSKLSAQFRKAQQREAEIWQTLIDEQRSVSRSAYRRFTERK